MLKVKRYRAVGISDIPVFDSKTKQRIQPEGRRVVPFKGMGVNENNQLEMMCVHPNESSIWLKDHDTKKTDKPNIPYMEVKGGVGSINESESKKIEFMKRWVGITTNASKFPGIKPVLEYLDAEKIADEGINLDKKYTEAKNLCYTASEKKIRAIAEYLNLVLADYDSLKEIRFALIRGFKPETAERFINDFHSERVEITYQVKMALEMQEIAIDSVSKNIVWANSFKPIISYDGQNAIDALVNFCASPEGRIFYQTITSGKITELDTKEDSGLDLSTTEEVVMDTREIVLMGYREGLLEPNAKGMVFYGGTLCGKGEENVIKHFKKNKQKLELLKEKLRIV